MLHEAANAHTLSHGKHTSKHGKQQEVAVAQQGSRCSRTRANACEYASERVAPTDAPERVVADVRVDLRTEGCRRMDMRE